MRKADGLSAEAAKHAELMLMDSADGNQFFQWIPHVAQDGDRTQPNGCGKSANGQDRRAQLKPEMQPDHPLGNRVIYDALEAEYRKVIGT